MCYDVRQLPGLLPAARSRLDCLSEWSPHAAFVTCDGDVPGSARRCAFLHAFFWEWLPPVEEFESYSREDVCL